MHSTLEVLVKLPRSFPSPSEGLPLFGGILTPDLRVAFGLPPAQPLSFVTVPKLVVRLSH